MVRAVSSLIGRREKREASRARTGWRGRGAGRWAARAVKARGEGANDKARPCPQQVSPLPRAFYSAAAAGFLAAPCLGLVAALSALGDAGRLAAAVAQVIELRAADGAAADDLDGIDHRRIEREHALDALAVGDLADREALVEAAAGAGDADALIGLNAGPLALLDLDVDGDGVAGLEIRDRLAELGDLLFFELRDDVHDENSCRSGALERSRAPRDFGVLL